jgi:hypothetical protein
MHEPDDTPEFDESVYGPPDGVLGAATTLQGVLLHGNECAVVIDDVVVYPTGFTFTVIVIDTAASETDRPASGDDPGWWPPGDELDTIAIRQPQCRLRFPDGTFTDAERSHPDDPSVPQIVSLGGRGGITRTETDYWVTPLPPPGQLTFEARWPDSDVPPESVTFDADMLLDAVSRTVRVWDDD